MKIEYQIKYLHDLAEKNQDMDLSWDMREAIRAGRDALQEKLARQNQEPLTLEDLKRMDGKRVWLQDLLIPKCSGWNFVQKSGRTTILVEPKFYPTADAMVPHYDTDDITGSYGKTWVVYRTKPE